MSDVVSETPAEDLAAADAATGDLAGSKGSEAFAMQSSPPPKTVNDLPPYSRSLLRIRVPVVVTLAQKRQALGRIVELGPGAIIHFDKSCEEMLELDVGGHPVALGEAVKVGDKFGLRVTSMIMPGERFEKVAPREPSCRKPAGQRPAQA